MKFSQTFLDEIRARVPLSEVVGGRVKLRRQGREWVGLSPFNAEKSPSFFVNDQKRFYKDFSSGKAGDVFTFLIDVEGLSFPEAVERLAARAGLAMPMDTPEERAHERRRASLHEVLALARDHFIERLNSRSGAKAQGYLSDRGINADLRVRFEIGFAGGERYELRDALAAKGVPADDMIEAGLLVHGEDVAVPYDRFRDRVMFPIHDRSGRVVAFGGRALDPAARAKYLNSPETPLFHKGAMLFNHHRARKPAHDLGKVIVVEGYVDAIMMSAAGFPQTVAPLGTALTPDQCGLLWSMAPEPLLCFDGDKAGLAAARRAIDVALPLLESGRSFRFVTLPEGKDPDDLVRSGGQVAVDEVLATAKPLAEVLFIREIDGQVLDSPERRAGLERRLKALISVIPDETLKRHYRTDIEKRLEGLFGEGLRSRGPQSGGERRPPTRRVSRGVDLPRTGFAASPLFSVGRLSHSRTAAPRELTILAVAISHPELLDRHGEAIAGVEFAQASLTALRRKLFELPQDAYLDSGALTAALDAVGAGDARREVLAAASAQPIWWCVGPSADLRDAERVLLQSLSLHRRTGLLNRDLRTAERELAEDPTEHNFAKLLEVKHALADVAGAEASADGFGESVGRGAPDGI